MTTSPERTSGSRAWWLELGGVLPRSAAALARAGRPTPGQERPGLVPTPRTFASVALDEFALAVAFLAARRRSEANPVAMGAEPTLACLRSAGVLDDPMLAYPAPSGPADVRLTRRSRPGLSFEHLSFPSAFRPVDGLPGASEWLAVASNASVHAYLLRADLRRRPWVVVLHGHRMGEPWDVRILGSQRLHRELGANVVHVVLPRHGPRGRGSPVRFPGVDPVVNLLGMTQAVWDSRAVIAWARGQGATQVGVYGISLGAQLAGLLASVEPDLACVIAGVPTADFASMLEATILTHWGESAVADSHVRNDTDRLLSRLVSPLAFSPMVPRDRRYIYAAIGDRIVTPEQAVALWTHWERPEILWLQGSHIANSVSRSRRFVLRSLAASGVCAD